MEQKNAYNTNVSEVSNLLNIGPKSSAWLRKCGIHTRADLEKVGPVAAYKMCRERKFHTSLNLLWALAGALLDIPWNQLPPELKEKLQREVE